MQKITPFLWFDSQAEEAMNFYCSIFKKSKVISTIPGLDGKVLGVTFEINGQEITALNGGPVYKLSPAFSLFVDCKTQDEVDELWTKLSDGGKTDQRSAPPRHCQLVGESVAGRQRRTSRIG